MRKMICAALAAAVILAAGIPAALAAHHGYRRRHPVCQPTVAEKNATEYCQFADEDQDGVCDRCDGDCQKCDDVQNKYCDENCDERDRCPYRDYETVSSEAESSDEKSIQSGLKNHHGHRRVTHKRGHH